MEKQINNKILSLLEDYLFDELSFEQRTMVLAECTEQEYRSYQLLLTETQGLSASQKLTAPLAVKANIHDLLAGKFHKPQSAVKGFLTAGVPLWLIGLLAAAFCLLCTYTDLFSPVDTRKQETLVESQQPEPIYVYLTDTVYQKIVSDPVIMTKEVIKIIEVEVPLALKLESAYIAGSQKELGLVEVQDFESENTSMDLLEEKTMANKGQSVAEERALMDLLDGIN